ncbi:MAG: hypothetical protein BZY75_06140 [SAR202 cluster bacterium Io17-Chloro-G7]|nr:MAG: hypothetical protein BZY75_06140 [SAR202 cluster bacterium Io17-Chloro-G7]
MSLAAKSLLSKLSGTALDLLLPMSCAGCGKEGKFLCHDCVAGLPLLKKPYCSLCASPGQSPHCSWCRELTPAFEGVRAPFLFDGAIRSAVYAFKYRGIKSAAPELGQLLADYLKQQPLVGDVLVPVPLHSRRLRHRGYNQSTLLAKELGKLTGIRVEPGLLTRNKDAIAQVHTTTKIQRRDNVAGSFFCTSDLSNKPVIIVDDVATTGSTLSACAAALKESGASSVWGLVLAREA